MSRAPLAALAALAALLRSRRGAAALTTALALPPLIFAMGLAVDLARAQILRNRLGAAIDAAGLAVGSSAGEADALRLRFGSYVLANLGEAQRPAGLAAMEAALARRGVAITFENTGRAIAATATAELRTGMLALLGKRALPVSVRTVIEREVTKLEVALVLDVTGSMAGDKIAALRRAATELIDVLYADPAARSHVRVAIVPYVTAVNIGAGNAASVFGLEDFALTGRSWKGCVMARSDEAEPGPKADPLPAGRKRWPAYFWPRETTHRQCVNYYSPTDPASRWDPNLACPEPVTPLSSDPAALKADIARLRHHNSGGTMTNVGLAWGLRLLSNQGPFAGARPFADREWRKVVVVMTDGENNVNLQHPNCDGNSGDGHGLDYGPYGYPDAHGTLGNAGVQGNSPSRTRDAAIRALNADTRRQCDAIKAAGALLYTITFRQNNAGLQALFRGCASDPQKYFDSPSNEALQRDFRLIAGELANLRIAE
ncbi:MAG TPA: vWA domain-containing protein [Alphaproteobacteria bacterium]|nr:vWA domain-containing protein [Alphaproteobacteria bacterium]